MLVIVRVVVSMTLKTKDTNSFGTPLEVAISKVFLVMTSIPVYLSLSL